MNEQSPAPQPKLALPPPEDKKEILAWTQPRWRSSSLRTGCEISDENGIFRAAFATLTCEDEDPAVHTYNDDIPLSLVKVATPEQKRKFVALQAEHDRIKEEMEKAEQDMAANGLPVSWEWILEHGKPHDDGYVPVPHHSKIALATLRKGSRVVIATMSSRYDRIAGKVGKIEKKRSKDVIVRFGQFRDVVPYCDLKPAKQVSAEERKRTKRGSETAAKAAQALRGLI